VHTQIVESSRKGLSNTVVDVTEEINDLVLENMEFERKKQEYMKKFKMKLNKNEASVFCKYAFKHFIFMHINTSKH
jgi:hypothetical protein